MFVGGKGRGAYIVTAENTDDLPASVELDEQPLVEVLCAADLLAV
jgi:hypothetical protein